MPDPGGLAAHYEGKHAVYDVAPTGLVVEAVRSVLDGGSVLDVGCASGALLAALRPHARRTAGLELSPTAAAAAARVADEVVCGALDGPVPPSFRDEPFDVVVCADVLEHLVDPLAGLRRATRWLRPGGAVVISVPNIGHWSARWRVARGRFRYDESGIFDEGHLRFFTLALLRSLVRDAGLEEVALRPVVPRLVNTVPVLGRLPRGAERVERAWQRVGTARPGLLGLQLVCLARRP